MGPMPHHHLSDPAPTAVPGPRFPSAKPVDFVIVGSGAAGGVMARELSRAGFSVVVLEQGPYLRERDFAHDELAVMQLESMTNDHKRNPHTFRASETETAVPRSASTPIDLGGSGGTGYGRVRGGSNGLAPAWPDTPISQSTFV